MNNLQVFNYNGNEVRTIQKDGEPWWVLKDVCEVLGLSSPHKVFDRLDEDEKGRNQIPTPGGEQEMTVINESGLYNVILRSDKPEAKPFRKWVTSEVLPSIRKHGAYMTPQKIEEALLNPDTIIKLATNLKAEREKRMELERQAEKDKPLVTFANSVSVAKASILVGELAKLLKQNGIEMGQNRLFTWMRENGYLISRKGTDYNMPTQRSMEMELFEIKLTTISHGDGHTSLNKTPKVTGKGQIYFINLFLKASA
ncbi:phage antirepressor protein [Firmicutes bacterium CAG:102]|nr:phage antirepressor protein [Firmicutes bacterium CAG:102]